jgi:hypothetical protein
MRGARLEWALTGMAVCGVACALVLPRAHDAGTILAAQDDPVALADAQLNSALRTRDLSIADQIESALAAHDPDLANSFVELAKAKNIPISDVLSQRVGDAVAESSSASHVAKSFASGLVTGTADDIASMTGTVAGDLFVFGDIRDVVREGKHLVTGEPTDRLILGLAAAGIAVTAATYVSFGAAAPERAGLTLVKDARKAGRLGEGLMLWAGRSARDVVDAPALENAVESASVMRPGQSVRAIKAAFRPAQAGGLVRLAKDVGRVGEKAGARGALDTLAIAEGPKDVSRAARLAESAGGKTRAIIKILGRGALLLAAGAFNLTWWVFGAVMTLFGLLCSIKATTERLTQSALDRKKRRRLRQQLAATQSALQPPSLAQAAAHS